MADRRARALRLGPLGEAQLRLLRELGVTYVRLGELSLRFGPAAAERPVARPAPETRRPPTAREREEHERARRRLALASSGVTLAPQGEEQEGR